MSRFRLVLAAVVIVVFGIAVAGAGMGHAPKGDPAPSAGAVAAAKQRLASGDSLVRVGRSLFNSEGCETCHAIAATGAKGKLGPRMDTDGDPVKDDIHNIVDPRSDIAGGYEQNAKLMPTDYAKRMNAHQLTAVATFIKTVSGSGH